MTCVTARGPRRAKIYGVRSDNFRSEREGNTMARLFLAAVVILMAPEVVITSAAAGCWPPGNVHCQYGANEGPKYGVGWHSGHPVNAGKPTNAQKKIPKLMNTSDYLGGDVPRKARPS